MAKAPPAFQFYPVDFLHGVRFFTLAERGAYISLLCEQWDEGGVSDQPIDLMKLFGTTSRKEADRIWATVGQKFQKGTDGLWRNARLEDERLKQERFRSAQSSRGKASAVKRSIPNTGSTEPQPSLNQGPLNQAPLNQGPLNQAPLNQGPLNPLSLSSSSSSDPLKQDLVSAPSQGARQGPLITSPLAFDRIHGQHVTGFCDWCCFPVFLAQNFANSADWTDAQVETWARSVRQGWTGGARGDELKFWRARWDERHPQASTPKTVGAKNADVMRRFVEKHS